MVFLVGRSSVLGGRTLRGGRSSLGVRGVEKGSLARSWVVSTLPNLLLRCQWLIRGEIGGALEFCVGVGVLVAWSVDGR